MSENGNEGDDFQALPFRNEAWATRRDVSSLRHCQKGLVSRERLIRDNSYGCVGKGMFSKSLP